MWNPNAICDGSPAHERAAWLVQNEGMTQHAAQQKVMSEFPSQFGGMSMNVGIGGMGMGVSMPGVSVNIGGTGMTPPGWNPNALCDGTRASERVEWLVSNQGMTHVAAQQKVMSEFPAQFGGIAMATPAMGTAVCAPVVMTPVVAGPQRCFKCEGKGFSHDSNMTHDKGPNERCFFCKNCSGCGGSGMISSGGTVGMGGMGAPAQPCFKCQGKGYSHDSSMTHDKGPDMRCFFCSDCKSCGGTGHIGGGTGMAMGGYGGGYNAYQGNPADDCKNCTIL
jgi:hypothetical protein